MRPSSRITQEDRLNEGRLHRECRTVVSQFDDARFGIAGPTTSGEDISCAHLAGGGAGFLLDELSRMSKGFIEMTKPDQRMGEQAM